MTVARRKEEATREQMRRGIGPDAVEQIHLANALDTQAVSSPCGGGGRSPRAAPSVGSGDKNGQ